MNEVHDARALYIHIPFCRSKCPYCSFYSIADGEGLTASYVEALLKQIENLSDRFSTIYIGGGTPTVLSLGQLKKLLGSLKKYVGRSVEFTVEANPESLTADKIKLFLDSGVNRISIGVQSLSDGRLAQLGRIHDSKTAVNAVMLSRKNGFRNINIDLIAGLLEDHPDSMKAEVEEAAGLPVTHISFYILSYEKGTPFYMKLKRGEIKPAADEIVSYIYTEVADFLGSRGFGHYEVSNFAKKGFESRHNLNYWANGPYTGLGSSACSYAGGVRSGNIADIGRYIADINTGKSPVSFREKLSPKRSAGETAAFKVRTAEGIDYGWFKKKTGFNLPDKAEAIGKLVTEGLIKFKKKGGARTGICLTKKGFLFCDIVSRELL